jgi:hypothetical protein
LFVFVESLGAGNELSEYCTEVEMGWMCSMVKEDERSEETSWIT